MRGADEDRGKINDQKEKATAGFATRIGSYTEQNGQQASQGRGEG
jgi:hypothetical protein